MRGSGDYDRKKKIQSKKRYITTGKKKRYSRLSDGCAVLAITTRKKKRYSRLSVECAVLAITTGKKKDTVVCLTGCAVVLFFVVAGYDRKKKVPVVCLAKEKRYSRLSVGCAVLTITTGKKKIQSSVWQVVLYVVSVFGSDGKLAVFLL